MSTLPIPPTTQRQSCGGCGRDPRRRRSHRSTGRDCVVPRRDAGTTGEAYRRRRCPSVVGRPPVRCERVSDGRRSSSSPTRSPCSAASRRSPAPTCASSAARSCCSGARTAPARRRCCGSAPACAARPRRPARCSGCDLRHRSATRCGRGSACSATQRALPRPHGGRERPLLGRDRRRHRRRGRGGDGAPRPRRPPRRPAGRRLSAGQRRRTALACLVARRAELWLLDEPHAGLDAAGRDELDATLRQAAAAGRDGDRRQPRARAGRLARHPRRRRRRRPGRGSPSTVTGVRERAGARRLLDRRQGPARRAAQPGRRQPGAPVRRDRDGDVRLRPRLNGTRWHRSDSVLQPSRPA